MRMNRRTALTALGVTTLAGTCAAVTAVSLGDQRDVFKSILTRLVGRFTIDDAGFDQFVADFSAAYGPLGTAKADALRVANAVPALVRLRPALARRMERFDRQLLTEFALATGLAGDPGVAKLEYVGLFRANACSNPFAHLT
jgi:hypothetical protein